jgi:hypothetical protein
MGAAAGATAPPDLRADADGLPLAADFAPMGFSQAVANSNPAQPVTARAVRAAPDRRAEKIIRRF